jgi:Zn-dependent M28 family amino/carboxypeptidase
MRALVLIIAACAGTALPTATAPRPDPLAAAALIAHVRELVDPRLAGREAASPGERAAATYVATRLRASGLRPVEHPVPHRTGSTNLSVHIAGRRAETIVIGAHLDHLGAPGGVLHPGADDTASGIAVVLGLAAALAADSTHLERGVLLVWFGAEEPGMIGSTHFVADPPVIPITAMINVDMIGRPLLDQPLLAAAMALLGIESARSVGLVGARRYPALRRLADDAFAAVGHRVIAPEDLPPDLARVVTSQTDGRGDSVPFERRGIPALFFGDGESSDYHQPSDTLDKLSPALLEVRARALLRLTIALSRAPASEFSAAE